MKFGTLIFLTTAILFGVPPIPVCLAAQSASSEIINFDAPGAGKTAGSGQGTFPDSINKARGITGHYVDSNNVNHGFLRIYRGDEFITFDAPGAGKTSGSGQGTFPRSISDAGAITGHYTGSNNVSHGFLRTPTGDELITLRVIRYLPQGRDSTEVQSLTLTKDLAKSDLETCTRRLGGV